MANEMPVFVFLECSFFHEILLLMFLVTQVIFVCILWKSCQRLELWDTISMLFIRGNDVSHAHHNVKHYGKHKILLLDTCLLYP